MDDGDDPAGRFPAHRCEAAVGPHRGGITSEPRKQEDVGGGRVGQLDGPAQVSEAGGDEKVEDPRFLYLRLNSNAVTPFWPGPVQYRHVVPEGSTASVAPSKAALSSAHNDS